MTGVCRAAGGLNITAGVIHAHYLIMDCPRFDTLIFDAYTGWNSVSRVILEEIIPRECVCVCECVSDSVKVCLLQIMHMQNHPHTPRLLFFTDDLMMM